MQKSNVTMLNFQILWARNRPGQEVVQFNSSFFDRELVLVVLYVTFHLVVVLLLPFLNLQAQIENIFHFLIEMFSFSN